MKTKEAIIEIVDEYQIISSDNRVNAKFELTDELLNLFSQQEQEIVEELNNIVQLCGNIREAEKRKIDIAMDNGMPYDPTVQSYALEIESIIDYLNQKLK